MQIGTTEPSMNFLTHSDEVGEIQTSILLSCDRPIMIFIDRERLETQYLREQTVNQAHNLQVPDTFSGKIYELLVYENSAMRLCIGSIEPQTKLQTRRIGFRKQVTKTILI